MKKTCPLPDLTRESVFWAQGYLHVAGLDEAGRGPWAGPVVAAAVILPPATATARRLLGVRDSKRVAPQERERLYALIQAEALAWGTGLAGPEEVDTLGIVAATRLAMQRAIVALPLPPQALLIDALRLPEVPLPQLSLVHGDALSLSIAAASIMAKVTRDRLMVQMDISYPGYGFARHKGYGTQAHARALAVLGPCPLHRRSFSPIRRILQGQPPYHPPAEGD